MDQIRRLCPDVCKDQPDGSVVVPAGPEKANCENKFECYAWDVQFQCMDKLAKRYGKRDQACIFGDGRRVRCVGGRGGNGEVDRVV